LTQIRPAEPKGTIGMTTFIGTAGARALRALPRIDTVAAALIRYGLVIVIGWIGLLKFAHYEAHQIQPLVAHSPFMGWLYSIFPEYTFSVLLGPNDHREKP
jgi:reactive chlorine resistance protein C